VTDATDNFNRASLGTNWTLGLNSIVTSGSTVAKGNSGGNDSSAWWNLDTFGGDHYAQIVIKTDGDGGGVLVRHQSGANTFYAFLSDGTRCTMYEVTGGTFATLGADYANNTVVNDVLKLDATGSTLTPSLNGTPLATRTDASITGGAPGLEVFSTTTTYDDWLGGPILSVGGTPYNPWPQLGPLLAQ
jgi:hypothetical protein